MASVFKRGGKKTKGYYDASWCAPEGSATGDAASIHHVDKQNEDTDLAKEG